MKIIQLKDKVNFQIDIVGLKASTCLVKASSAPLYSPSSTTTLLLIRLPGRQRTESRPRGLQASDLSLPKVDTLSQ